MWCMYVWMLLYSVWLPSGAFLMVFPTSVAKKPLTTTYFFCQALEVNLAAIFRISLQFSAFYRDFPWSNGIFLVTMAESYLIGFQSFVSLRRMNWRACLGNLFVFTSIVRVVVHVLACVATCVIVRSAILDPSRDFSRRETQLRLYPGFQSAKAA